MVYPDRNGYLHPSVNRRGTPHKTETVGYHCLSDSKGRYAIANGVVESLVLTQWHNRYSEAVMELEAGERREWGLSEPGMKRNDKTAAMANQTKKVRAMHGLRPASGGRAVRQTSSGPAGAAAKKERLETAVRRGGKLSVI